MYLYMTKGATVTKRKHTGKLPYNLTHTHTYKTKKRAVDLHGNHSTLRSDEKKKHKRRFSPNTLFLNNS